MQVTTHNAAVPDMLRFAVQASLAGNMAQEGDTTDAEGFLVCGKCGGRKQALQRLPSMEDAGEMGLQTVWREVVVGTPCPCKKAVLDALDQERKAHEHQTMVNKLSAIGVASKAYRGYTFDADDSPQSPISKTCRAYIQEWTQMRAQNMGMILYGSVGTGKSFYACAIANALIEREIGVYVITAPDLIAKMNGFDSREETLNRIKNVALLVLDDLGAERGSEYSVEQLYIAIDTRYRVGKPLIATTNLTVQEIEHPADAKYHRIFDRINEMCPISVAVEGISRRIAAHDAKREAARRLIKTAAQSL